MTKLTSGVEYQEYQLIWTELNRSGEVVAKEKWFDSEAETNKYIRKLEKKKNFIRVSNIFKHGPFEW